MDWGLERYRCVICWRLIPWWLGCADAAERDIGEVISRKSFIDSESREVTDAGLCDDCWCAHGGEAIRVDYVDD